MKHNELAAAIRMGSATPEQLNAADVADVLAIKSEPVPRSVFLAAKPHSVDRDKRMVLGVPHSTEAVDRMGDIIKVSGWDLSAFKDNPVLLFGHNQDALPIGTMSRVRKGQSASGMRALLADETYHTEDMNPKAELVWNMVAAGALPGRSVGFMPVETYRPKDEKEREKLGLGGSGVVYTKAQLLESSVVPVPANQTALQGKALAAASEVLRSGDYRPEVVEWFRKECPLTEQMAEIIEREIRRSTVQVKLPEVDVDDADEPDAVDDVDGEEQREWTLADIGATLEETNSAIKALTVATAEADGAHQNVALLLERVEGAVEKLLHASNTETRESDTATVYDEIVRATCAHLTSSMEIQSND